jgi:poly(hydroxyalkanoate) depolymerase family esterase
MNATRLTHKGNLLAATAAIREALSGGRPGSVGKTQPGTAAPPLGDVIDIEAREVPVAPNGTSSADETPIGPDVPSSGTEPHVEPDRMPGPAPDDTAPQFPNGRFIPGSFANGSGSRNYKLYIPPAAGTRALPLVVMLHGCTQDADDFATGTAMNELARSQQFFVLYPTQSMRANPQRCWNWFKHNHQQRGRGEPELLAGMTREVMQRNPIDPARIYVAGISAGGSMAAILGDAYPDLFAAVGVHSGLAAGAANDMSSAFGAMKNATGMASASVSGVPTIAFHGDADSVVHPGNARQVITASTQPDANVEVQHGVSSGGQRYTRELHHAPGGGPVIAEQWTVHGLSHAWSGGNAAGSYTDPAGPDATAEMVRFLFAHVLRTQH